MARKIISKKTITFYEGDEKLLENILKATLIAQSKTGFVYPSFKQGDDLGKIKDIKVMRRGTSGKAIEVEIMTTKNCYRVAKELVIRRVFQKDGISLPSAKDNEGVSLIASGVVNLILIIFCCGFII